MPDFIKAAWFKFVNQPGSVHLLLAVALLVITTSLMSPDRQSSEDTLQENNISDLDMTAPGIEAPHSPAPTATTLAPAATSDALLLSESTPTIADASVIADHSSGIEGVTDSLIPAQAIAHLVLIIDDIGYNADAGRRAISLPGQVTYAVIPYTPHGKTLAETAHQANKEVMLHAPMSNLSGMDLGHGGLTLLLNEEEFVHTLQMALADIPHIKGVNNHTGSELTAAAQPMQWLMQELKGRGLYFVDSVTTNASVAAATAEQYQVPSLRRHVFLDNVQTAEAIDAEFQRALALAEKQGFAVAIGHPYPETLAYLETALPWLAARNIKLISASDMIAQLQTAEPVETTAAW